MAEFLASLKSLNTTLSGVALLLIALGTAIRSLTDGDPSTTVDWAVLAAEITAAIGLIMARDGGKSSSRVGAK